MPARKKSDVIQLSKIRMREALRARLARHAEANGVSLNAEIVFRLERSLQDQEILTEIRSELAAMKEAMRETQEAQFARFLDEWQQEQFHQAEADRMDD